MSRSSLALSLGALAIVVLAAGCGSSGGEGDGATGPTKAAYIKRADAICTRTNNTEAEGISNWEVEHGAVEPWFKPPTRVQELKVVLPLIRQEAEEIARLKPPPGEEAKVNAFVSAFQDASKETIADLLDGVSKKYQGAYRLMKNYGFKVCGY